MPNRTLTTVTSVRSTLAVLVLLAGLAVTATALARGGQAADDCPPGSKDPDCRTIAHPP